MMFSVLSNKSLFRRMVFSIILNFFFDLIFNMLKGYTSKRKTIEKGYRKKMRMSENR